MISVSISSFSSGKVNDIDIAVLEKTASFSKTSIIWNPSEIAVDSSNLSKKKASIASKFIGYLVLLT